ncbi:nucleolar/coiled-body phosphoprotein [Wolffia australiana]
MPSHRRGELNSVGASSLLSFVPRPVMLDSSPFVLGNSQEKKTTKKKTKKVKNDAQVTALLVRAISSFLESNGFTQTLSAFRSETQFEIEDGCESPALNLKEVARKYLETSVNAIEGKAENKGEIEKTEEGTQDLQEKSSSKKKKKVSSSAGEQILAEEKVKDVDIAEEKVQNVPPASNGGFEGQETSETKKKKKKTDKKNKGAEKNDKSTSSEITEDAKEKSSSQISVIVRDSQGKEKNKKKRKHEIIDASSVQEGDLGKKSKSESKKEESNSDLHSNGEVHTPGEKPKSEKSKLQVKESQEIEEPESNGTSKSGKSEKKLSTASKTADAFQRVKVDAIEFADSRLQDNSYWAKGGAEIGYGAKAQEVLGQVRGRDFRHEKTKKKRGSYRGGQIDFQSHSVKFQYSEEED